jgi:hypothetical protein
MASIGSETESQEGVKQRAKERVAGVRITEKTSLVIVFVQEGEGVNDDDAGRISFSAHR